MVANVVCQTPFGDFRVSRYPTRRDEPLQAWCAADLLLLDEIHHLGVPGSEVLAVNDEHGVLCVALQPRALWTDSALAVEALRRNLADNGLPAVPVVWSTSSPPAGPALVALRVPKQLPYLEHQLDILSRLMPPGAVLLAAGMDKHLSPRVAELLERYIGPTQRHRGRRKARLFSARRDGHAAAPSPGSRRYFCAQLEAELQALPNVFSQEKLDGGSRLLLAELERLAPAATLLDLACGNGVLGLAAFRRGLAPRVVFADESAMAIASAKANAAHLFPQDPTPFLFHHADGLLQYDGPQPDLVLCNPPFHLNHAVDEFAGRRLLQQCADALPPGGRLCLVGNRHLDYQTTLKRCFGRVSTLARDPRFTVWLARHD